MKPTNRKVLLFVGVFLLTIQSSVSLAQSDYLTYNKDDVSINADINLVKNDYFERNITINEMNSSFTVIAQVNNGKLWGIIIEQQYNYYKTKAILPDPRIFCGLHALLGEQLLPGLDYYGSKNVSLSEGKYVLAVYNLNDQEGLNLHLTVLNKVIGPEVLIPPPDSLDLFKLSFIVIVFVTLSFFVYKFIDKVDKYVFKK